LVVAEIGADSTFARLVGTILSESNADYTPMSTWRGAVWRVRVLTMAQKDILLQQRTLWCPLDRVKSSMRLSIRLYTHWYHLLSFLVPH